MKMRDKTISQTLLTALTLTPELVYNMLLVSKRIPETCNFQPCLQHLKKKQTYTAKTKKRKKKTDILIERRVNNI